ncbi:hypothetical protein KAI32_04230 [Candidatus Pacearchaeota archaeon]|nr:hypothetical protein [Candidatus Pacearchaeota archaeon]
MKFSKFIIVLARYFEIFLRLFGQLFGFGLGLFMFKLRILSVWTAVWIISLKCLGVWMGYRR